MRVDWDRGNVILVDGQEVARADRSWLRERAEVQVGTDLWLFRAEGIWGRPPLVAELDGVARMGARASGFLTTTWAVDAGAGSLEVAQAGMFSSRLLVVRGGARIGEIGRSGFFTNRPQMDLTEAVDVPVACFLLWLAFVEFNRRQSQAAAAST